MSEIKWVFLDVGSTLVDGTVDMKDVFAAITDILGE